VTIGFLGAGQLGEPMVRRLLGAGHDVVVYARRDDVRERIRDQGGSLTDSAAELAEHSDILISCLFSDAQLSELSSGIDGFATTMRVGTVFVSHTTGAVSTLKELANRCRAAVVDAPVSGTADHIAEGRLTVLIGGDADAVERVTPVLAAYANPIVATGGLGSALTIKLVNNVLFAANSQLVAAALELANGLGVSSQALLEALSVCSAGSTAASYVSGVGGIEEFAVRSTPFLRKDVAAAVTAAREAGADLGYLQRVVETGPLELVTSPTR
jgi:3-hydroxyisobutyrate dehydrogenase-like beta-hydroxyacid dehydrogenase